MLVTFGIYFKQRFDTRYLVFYNPSPLRMFLSLHLLSEYRIQHGAIGPLYVTSSYSTWIFCRAFSGFATDCPCDVWCRGLTTCLLHVGPPFGNRFLNNSWAVGLTLWIVYLHFFCILPYAIIYVLIHHIIFWLHLYFLNIYFFQFNATYWEICWKLTQFVWCFVNWKMIILPSFLVPGRSCTQPLWWNLCFYCSLQRYWYCRLKYIDLSKLTRNRRHIDHYLNQFWSRCLMLQAKESNVGSGIVCAYNGIIT